MSSIVLASMVNSSQYAFISSMKVVLRSAQGSCEIINRQRSGIENCYTRSGLGPLSLLSADICEENELRQNDSREQVSVLAELYSIKVEDAKCSASHKVIFSFCG